MDGNVGVNSFKSQLIHRLFKSGVYINFCIII